MDHSIPGLGQFRHTPPYAHLSLSLEANAGSSLAAPSPLLTLLGNQPVDSSSSPASAPPLVKPQEMPTEHVLVGHPALCSAFPFPPLAFSLHLQRLGSNQGRLGPSPAIHTMYPPPSHEVKKKKVKHIHFTNCSFIVDSSLTSYRSLAICRKENRSASPV